MISYHFYAHSQSRTDPKQWEVFFSQLDSFVPAVEEIEQIRKSLSPQTRTTIDELGVILADDHSPTAPQFPLIYWNAAAALYVYSWLRLSRLGIDIVGHSQLVGQYCILSFLFYTFFLMIGYPELPGLQLQPQYPSVALLNWTTGEGSAKYWTSKLLIETVDVDSDQAVLTQTTDLSGQNISCQGFVKKDGRRWVLIINKRYGSIDVLLPGSTNGQMRIINEASGFGPPTEITLISDTITLSAYAVAVVHMPAGHVE